MEQKMNGWLKLSIIVGSVILGLFFLFYLPFLNHVGINELGVAYNSWSGEVKVQDTPGWYCTSPLVLVTNISTLPMMVHIPSGAKVINTKLVRFKKEGLQDFIKLQGFNYALSSSQENIMMGYAFSGMNFSFLEIVQEGGDDKAALQGKL